ncbi:ATP synthase delta chain chloroplastic [Phtheirospermum japonicum]|uniref:ATP synthase delta chain chloroplastic n=1 Tax=Phtheirospermum japonicum TaxID=374723 RepID=A0A830C1L9_9LAMI|nr:ATP synthase delta chain chloroplastic [Phtheirospermum japonicum]
MDTLSAASVSSFKLPTALHPKSHELHLFKHHFSQQFTKQKNPKVSKNFNNPPLLNSSSQPNTTLRTPKQSLKLQESHQNPSTGYAVALLDAARCHDALESVSRDVKRLSRWLSSEEINSIVSNPCVGKNEKAEILREIVKKGKFHKYLSKLVKLLVEKTNCKVEMVREVLVEFRRIYDELAMNGFDCTTTGVKMEINQVLEVAKRVQKISGAVRVSVRQLVDDRLYSSFAV